MHPAIQEFYYLPDIPNDKKERRNPYIGKPVISGPDHSVFAQLPHNHQSSHLPVGYRSAFAEPL
jgi:hypothetical protein